MKQTTESTEQRNKRITETKALYIAFNKSFLWLQSIVNQGLISEREAGYILTVTK